MSLSLSNMRREYSIYMIGKVIVLLFSLLTMKVFTSTLGLALFGQYQLILTTYTLFVLSIYNWIPAVIIRFYPHDKNEYDRNMFKKLIATFFIYSTIMSTIIVFVLIILKSVFFEKHNLLFTNIQLILLLVMIITGSAALITLQYLRGSGQSKTFNMLTVFEKAGILLFSIIIFNYINAKIVGIQIALIITSIFIIIYGIIKNKDIKYLVSPTKYSLMKPYLKYGLPITLIYFAAAVISGSDRYCIAYYLGNEAVGLYSATYALSEKSLGVMGSILLTAQLPVIVKLWENGAIQECELIISNALKLLVIICAPIIIWYIFYGSQFITFITTSDFSNVAYLLPIISTGTYFMLVSYIIQQVIILKKNSLPILKNTLTAACLNIILNIIFIPIYGMTAAAAVTLISYLVLLYLNLRLAKLILEIKIYKWDYIKIIISLAILTISLYCGNIIKLHIISSIIIATIIYLLTLITLKVAVVIDIIQLVYKGVRK